MRTPDARVPMPEASRTRHSPGIGPLPDAALVTRSDQPADPPTDSGWVDLDPGWVDPRRPDPIRRVVVDRLAIAGRRHTRHRVERSVRTGRPGPHAVVFLFREPDPERQNRINPDRVTVATRMFVDGPDVADLSAVLATLTDRAREYGRPLPDLIAYLADRVEPRGRSSTYLGVAVSSIDIAREGAEPMPWDGLIHLVDGTRMSLHATRPEFSPQVVSTHTLAHHAPVWEHHTWIWAATPTATPTRTDLPAAHNTLAAFHQHLRDAEPGRTDPRQPAQPVSSTGRSPVASARDR